MKFNCLTSANELCVTMLLQRIKRVLIFFDISGYNTGTSKLSSHRKYLYCINFVHISLAMFFSLYKGYLVFKLQRFLRLIETLNQMLQYSTALFTYWLVILDSMILWREHRHFWNILDMVDKQLFPQKMFPLRSYVVKCGIFISITMTSFFAYKSDPLFYVIFFLVKICQVRLIYYLFCLEMIQYQLNAIENELNRTWSLDKVFHRKIDCLQLKWLRVYYYSIHKLTSLLNDIFGYSHVAAISLIFYIALTELNWLCAHFQEIPIAWLFSKFIFNK